MAKKAQDPIEAAKVQAKSEVVAPPPVAPVAVAPVPEAEKAPLPAPAVYKKFRVKAEKTIFINGIPVHIHAGTVISAQTHDVKAFEDSKVELEPLE